MPRPQGGQRRALLSLFAGIPLGRGLDRADGAMYAAKRAGGMRYMVADLGRLFDDETDVA